MPAYYFNRTLAGNFDSLVGMPFDLASPFRSTIPLLAYWAEAAIRLGAFGNAIGIPLAEDAALKFEFTVNPLLGQGNASHTDLLIQFPGITVGIEAKYTERPYQTVAEWLGPQPTHNKLQVLQGWLNAINGAVGSDLDVNMVHGITYQLIHRTASVCIQQAKRRAVVYHCIDPTNEHVIYYSNQLQTLSGLIASGDELPFYLYQTKMRKTDVYEQLQVHWAAIHPAENVTDAVRGLLIKRNIAVFGEPDVRRL